MAFLCVLYLLMESGLVFLCCWAVILVLKMVYVARWSVMGGEMVPAVVVVCVKVVSVTSMRVEVLWWESYLVGVVIVVCRLFSTRKSWKLGVSFRRFMLMSLCKVIDVPGFFVLILSIVVCRFLMRSGSWCGLLYMFMIVWIGLLFCSLSWIWMIIVAVFGVGMSRVELCMSFFT